MALILENITKFSNGIEVKNSYLSVKSFRYLSDVQLEARIEIHMSAEAKNNNLTPLKEQILILDITKSELGSNNIYSLMYIKIKEYYPDAVDLIDDVTSDCPDFYNGLKDDSLSGMAAPNAVIIIKTYKYDSGMRIPVDEEGKWVFKIPNIGASILVVSVKEEGKKESKATVIEIIEVKEKEYTYVIK